MPVSVLEPEVTVPLSVLVAGVPDVPLESVPVTVDCASAVVVMTRNARLVIIIRVFMTLVCKTGK